MNSKLLKIIESWPFLLGLVLGLYTVVFSITGFDLSYFPGDLGDARFNTFVLEHAHQFISGQQASLWNAPFMYPEANAITYSDNLIGTAPIYSIFRWLGSEPLTAFQLWFIVLFILNYSTAFLFIKWLFRNKYAAVIGAFIFAFSLGLQSQITHAQLFPRFFIPLALWMAMKFSDELNPKYLFLTLFCVVAQFYAGIYLGFMLVIPMVLVMLYALFSNWSILKIRLREMGWIVKSGSAILSNIFLLLILMLPYYERSKLTGTNPYESIVASIPTVKSFFFSQKGSLLWDGLSEWCLHYPAAWDHQIMPGIIALLSLAFFLLLFILKRARLNELVSNHKYLTMGVIATVGTFAFFTRYQGYSLYKIIYSLPGFGSMRSLTRIINVELLFFGIAVAAIFLILASRFKKYTTTFFIIFLAIIVTDNFYFGSKSYRTSKSEAVERIHALRNKMAHIPKGAIVSYEPEKKDLPIYVYQIDAMLASQSLGLKTVNGYTATSPYNYHHFWVNMDEESRNIWFETMKFEPDTVYVVN